MDRVTVRVVYSKLGQIRFISHLDLMRTIFRGFMRAGVPIELSQGFSPHQLIAFGPPLSVGMEGENEFFDFNMDAFYDLKKIMNDVQCAFYNILEIKDIHYHNRSRDSITKEIDLIAYTVYIGEAQIEETTIDSMESRKEIFVERVTPEKTKRIDIRPLMRKLSLSREGTERVLLIELFSANGQYANPYDVIKVLFGSDDRRARAFRVKRTNMFSTVKTRDTR
jgi:radical SAM-linked protein